MISKAYKGKRTKDAGSPPILAPSRGLREPTSVSVGGFCRCAVARSLSLAPGGAHAFFCCAKKYPWELRSLTRWRTAPASALHLLALGLKTPFRLAHEPPLRGLNGLASRFGVPPSPESNFAGSQNSIRHYATVWLITHCNHCAFLWAFI